MVSRDAHLVVGADSEEVIVANRHGDDRPNAGGRTFESLSGSLEHNQALNCKHATILGRFGVREHACEALDGRAGRVPDAYREVQDIEPATN